MRNFERAGQDDVVGEEHAAREQRGREDDEAADEPLGLLGHGRREEPPDLPEEDRQRDGDRHDRAHLHRVRERLDDAEGDQLVLLVGRERALEPIDDPAVEAERDAAGREDREERHDEPVSQLSEVLDERRLLAMAEPPGDEPSQHG